MRLGTRRSPAAALLAALCLAALAGCGVGGRNYTDPAAPRYAGGRATASAPVETLKLVSFNLRWADSVDAAIRLLRAEPSLRDADLVFLQEMDAPGTERIAGALDMTYVYYPAIQRTKTGQDFGNAVLSRWPIADDAKLILPHHGIFVGTQRIASAATIHVGERAVRVYSVHLGTPINLASPERVEQLRTILDDARPFRHVIVAGDMNDAYLGEVAVAWGYEWPTRSLPVTARIGPIGVGTWDHAFLKGFSSPRDGAGVVTPPDDDISDHKPVWVTAAFR